MTAFYLILTAGMAITQGVRAARTQIAGAYVSAAFWGALHVYVWLPHWTILTVVLGLLGLRLGFLVAEKQGASPETLSAVLVALVAIPTALIMLPYWRLTRKKVERPLEQLPKDQFMARLTAWKPDERARLAGAVQQMRLMDALPIVEQHVRDGHSTVEVFPLLGELGGRSSLLRVVDTVEASPDRLIKQAFLEVLMKLGPGELELHVLKALDDADLGIALTAARVLLIHTPDRLIDRWPMLGEELRANIVCVPPEAVTNAQASQRRVRFHLSQTHTIVSRRTGRRLEIVPGVFECLLGVVRFQDGCSDRDSIDLSCQFRNSTGAGWHYRARFPCDILWPVSGTVEASHECDHFFPVVSVGGCDDARDPFVLRYDNGEELEGRRKYLGVQFDLQLHADHLQIKLDTQVEGDPAVAYYRGDYESLLFPEVYGLLSLEEEEEDRSRLLDIRPMEDLPGALRPNEGVVLAVAKSVPAPPEVALSQPVSNWEALLTLAQKDSEEVVREACQEAFLLQAARSASWFDNHFPLNSPLARKVSSRPQRGEWRLRETLEIRDQTIPAGTYAVEATARFEHETEDLETGTDKLILTFQLFETGRIVVPFMVDDLLARAFASSTPPLQYWHELPPCERDAFEQTCVVWDLFGGLETEELRLRLPPVDVSLANPYQTVRAAITLEAGGLRVLFRGMQDCQSHNVPGVLARISIESFLAATRGHEVERLDG